MKIWNSRLEIMSNYTVLNGKNGFSTSSTEKIFFDEKTLRKKREKGLPTKKNVEKEPFLGTIHAVIGSIPRSKNNAVIWSSHGYWISSTTSRF